MGMFEGKEFPIGIHPEGILRIAYGDSWMYVPEVEEKKIKTLSEKTSYRGMIEVIWPVIMCYSRTLE